MQIVDGLLLPSTFDELLELRYGLKANSKTDIYGSGWGSIHWWRKVGSRMYLGSDGEEHSTIGGPTYYRCQRCGVLFRHWYNDIPDIFVAMSLSGIPDICRE